MRGMGGPSAPATASDMVTVSHPGVRPEGAVERVEEVVAGAHVALPGVLAVEEDPHRGRPRPPSRRQASPAPTTRSVKSATASTAGLPGVAEAHQVGDPPVPEEHGHLPVAGGDAPRAVERERPAGSPGGSDRSSTASSEAAQATPSPARISRASGETAPSAGHMPAAGRPKRRAWLDERVGGLAPGVVRARRSGAASATPGSARAAASLSQTSGRMGWWWGVVESSTWPRSSERPPARQARRRARCRWAARTRPRRRPRSRAPRAASARSAGSSASAPKPIQARLKWTWRSRSSLTGEGRHHLVQVHPGQVAPALLEQLEVARHGAHRAVPVHHEEGVEQPASLLRARGRPGRGPRSPGSRRGPGRPRSPRAGRAGPG